MNANVDRIADQAIAGGRLTPGQWARFESHLREILAALGVDPDGEGTRGTAGRLLDAWIDATSGYVPDPKLVTTFAAERCDGAHGANDQVIEGPIPFTALCEHHALPFLGSIWIGYVAAERLIGLSKLTRIARQYSRRFTMQERIGREIGAELAGCIGARGVAVRIEAVHLCTRMRGVREAEALTTTSAWHGSYQSDAALRAEFLALCARR